MIGDLVCSECLKPVLDGERVRLVSVKEEDVPARVVVDADRVSAGGNTLIVGTGTPGLVGLATHEKCP